MPLHPAGVGRPTCQRSPARPCRQGSSANPAPSATAAVVASTPPSKPYSPPVSHVLLPSSKFNSVSLIVMPELFTPSATCAAFQPKCSPITSQRDRHRSAAIPNTAPNSAVLSCASSVTLGFWPCSKANPAEVRAMAAAGPTPLARNCSARPRSAISSPAAPTARSATPASLASVQSNRTAEASEGVQAAHPCNTTARTRAVTAAAPSAVPQNNPPIDRRPSPMTAQETSGRSAAAAPVTASEPTSSGIVLNAITSPVNKESSTLPANDTTSTDTMQRLAARKSATWRLRDGERLTTMPPNSSLLRVETPAAFTIESAASRAIDTLAG